VGASAGRLGKSPYWNKPRKSGENPIPEKLQPEAKGKKAG
jgi:hypothetical protein